MPKIRSDLQERMSHPPITGIHRFTSKFMNQGKELLRRLRSTEEDMLTESEMRMLRLQLHLLDIEVSNRQHTRTPVSIKNPSHSTVTE